MIRRFLAAGIAAAAITAAAVVSSATPTAAVVVQYEELAGNFVGDERDEGFTYQAGSALDGIIVYGNGGVSGGDLSIDFHADIQLGGTYDPIVGNFDGDAHDEILWYAPGTARDSLWNFVNLSHAQSTPFRIDGTYEPVAGDFTGDGVDDVLWYAPGTAKDSLWDFNPDGRYVSTPLTMNSRYTPLAASIGSDATDDVLWYAPGTATDYLWNFRGGQSHQRTETVNGDYHSTPTGDFFGGLDDIVWIGSSAGYLWDHAPSSNPAFIDRWIYDVYAPSAAPNPATHGGTLPTAP